MAQKAAKQLLGDKVLKKLRIDALLIIALLASSFYVYGSYWWMLLGALTVRGMMISMVDNSFHYGTPLDDIKYAFNLSASPLFSRLILHFNLHHVHHVHPGLPWTALPLAFNAGEYDQDGGNFVTGVLRQLRGPIPQQDLENSAG